jgi:hypothetical protein
LFFFLVSAVLADRVVLKTGTELEGAILGKSDVILKIFSEQFQRSIVIEKEAVDYIEYDGKRFTFDEFALKSGNYNPKFKVAPRRPKPVIKAKPDSLLTQDIFKTLGLEGMDSMVTERRALNLFFNAPLRWGSVGFGYLEARRLESEDGEKFHEYDFKFRNEPFSMRCLNAQVRRNFMSNRGTLGSLVLDVGYGKKTLDADIFGGVLEAAIMRYLSVRYVYCRHEWLLSPGLSAGAMILKAGVIRYSARSLVNHAESARQVDLSFYRSIIRPLLGADLNFYDVVSVNASLDVLKLPKPPIYINLAFLMPFVQ